MSRVDLALFLVVVAVAVRVAPLAVGWFVGLIDAAEARVDEHRRERAYTAARDARETPE